MCAPANATQDVSNAGAENRTPNDCDTGIEPGIGEPPRRQATKIETGHEQGKRYEKPHGLNEQVLSSIS